MLIWFVLLTGGLLWFDGDSDEASLNPALNIAMLMARYAPMASTPDKTTAYQVRATYRVQYIGMCELTDCAY